MLLCLVWKHTRAGACHFKQDGELCGRRKKRSGWVPETPTNPARPIPAAAHRRKADWQSVCVGAADKREAAAEERAHQSRRKGRSHKAQISASSPIPSCFHNKLVYINALLERVSQGVVMLSVKCVFVFQVYLQAQKKEQDKTQQSLKMLSDEVSQIQEVRYCLKSLREQMAAKNNHRTEHKVQLTQTDVNRGHCAVTSLSKQDNEDKQEFLDEQERDRMREVSKRLYTQLQEAEKKHQEEKENLQAEAGHYKRQLSEQNDQLKEAQLNAQQQDQRIRELQRLMSGMEHESSSLRDELMTREAALLRLQELREEGQADRESLKDLEKDNAILKEKIHHLDDMLKSQQRKLRQMIEQLQNSRMVIQERDRVIKELEEKVAFLEAENRELRDQMDFLNGQRSNSGLMSDSNAQIVYSKPLKPSTQSNKNLPFIKVIEIKS